jgi:hypothetical protein
MSDDNTKWEPSENGYFMPVTDDTPNSNDLIAKLEGLRDLTHRPTVITDSVALIRELVRQRDEAREGMNNWRRDSDSWLEAVAQKETIIEAAKAAIQGALEALAQSESTALSEREQMVLNEVADYLSVRGRVWYGDNGVEVMTDMAARKVVKLIDWLRAGATREDGR